MKLQALLGEMKLVLTFGICHQKQVINPANDRFRGFAEGI